MGKSKQQEVVSFLWKLREQSRQQPLSLLCKKLWKLLLADFSSPHTLRSLAADHFERQRWVDHLRSGVRDQPGQHGETLSLTKNTKISSAWRWMPVIPATLEAEAGELLEPGSLGKKSKTLSPKKKKEKMRPCLKKINKIKKLHLSWAR
ncbi:LOW QUALITY PROTEIN: hypothetical protein AAY473_012891 [Plecturocebus cupreus]